MRVLLVRGNRIMHILYLILFAIFSPLLFTIPILTLFVGVPILIFGMPGLLWRACKKVLFPTIIKPIPATAPAVLVSSFPKRSYKPKGKRSKMAGIRRNRAILNIAKGGNHA